MVKLEAGQSRRGLRVPEPETEPSSSTAASTHVDRTTDHVEVIEVEAPAKVVCSAPDHVVAAHSQNQSLSLLPQSVGLAPTRGSGYRRRLDKLNQVREDDPEVQRIFHALGQMMSVEVESDQPTLAAALRNPSSPSRAVLTSYLEWVAHRGAKEAAPDPTEQESRRQLDPALMRTRVDAIVDLLVERIVQLDAPVPPAAAEALLALFAGGAERIQTRANTWMLNGKISDIAASEAVLADGEEVDAEAIFAAAVHLHELDGGTPLGFQPPLAPGQSRLTERGVVQAEEVPAEVASTALVKAETSLAKVATRGAAVNILQQSTAASVAVSKMEAALAQMDPSSSDFAEALDVYHSYTHLILYDSQRIWTNKGVLDQLATAAVVHGSNKQREAVLDFLYDGEQHIGDVVRSESGPRSVGLRETYVALRHLILARETWDLPTLDFVLENLAFLKSGDCVEDFDAADLAARCRGIVEYRRSEALDWSEMTAALKTDEPKPTHLGSFTMKACLRDTGANGCSGPVLEIRELRSKLSSDTESLWMIAQIESFARVSGYTAIQLADWSNIHEGRVFESTGEYETVMRPKAVGAGRSLDAPTYVKSLAPKLQPPVEFDVSQLNRFLDAPSSRGLVRLANFGLSFRKGPSTVANSANTLTLTLVDADTPGSGQYKNALDVIEEAAAAKGLDCLLIEGVDVPRHWAFYERNGFERAPGDRDEHRSYLKRFEPATKTEALTTSSGGFRATLRNFFG